MPRDAPLATHASEAALIAALLVASGAAGLAYEVLWARDWALVYGTTAVGTAVVLAAYFAGLAVGAPLGARLARGRNALRVYGVLELALAGTVAAYVALRPSLPLLAAAVRAAAPAALLPLARTAGAFAALGLPTILLGATLPAAAGVLPPTALAAASRLYGWNTLGGALGACLTGFVGIRWLGVRGTFAAAIAVDAAVGVAALVVARPAAASARAARPRPTPVLPRRTSALPRRTSALPRRTTALAALVGFAALAGQVLWVRGVAGVLSNSVYSVTLVLAATLLGIVAGATIAGRLLARPAPPVGIALAVAAAAIALSRLVLESLPRVSLALIVRLGAASATSGLVIEACLAALAVLPPTAALAMTLPLLLARTDGAAPSPALGRLLAANTAGGIAGALVGAFVVLPSLGLGGGLLAVAALVLGAALLAGVGWAPAAVAAAVLGVVAVRGTALPLPWRETSHDQVLFYRDGAAATVIVTADARGAKRLRVNGQYSLGGTTGLLLESREAHVPLLLHPAPARLLHLGVGTGDTIGAASTHPGLAIDGVELIPEVLDAVPLFARENRDVVHRPGVRLVADDARSFLLAGPTSSGWDVILSDLFLPWAAGAASLYSQDFYRLGRAHLRPGGLYCQWLPLHQLAVDDLAKIVRTFTSVFPDVQLWVAYHRNTTPLAALVGSATPLAVDGNAVRRRLADLHDAVAEVGLVEPGDLAALWVADGDTLRAATAAAPLITDDRPTLELTAPAAYFQQERLAPASLAWLAGVLAPGDGPIAGAPAPLALRRALLAAQRALVGGDGPGELRAYLDAFAVAPTLPTVRFALAAIAHERRAAGDPTTAARIDALLGK